MTKDEIVNLCFVYDRPRARLVADKLRNYIIQISESEGFDFNVFPGNFSGVAYICPISYYSINPLLHRNLERLAVAAISKYNSVHKETVYEVVDVETVNVYAQMKCRYYVTSDARDVNATDGALKTFQAIVVADWMPPKANCISHVSLCRPKPNLW